MNSTSTKILRGVLLATSCLAASGALAGTVMPVGGNVVVGKARITTPGSSRTVVRQSTNKALINWSSFSIGPGGTVVFKQPGQGAITVNRVTGPESSSILGSMLANGQIWLINANGILFGHGSQINVAGLIATTSDISNNDFRKGDYRFSPAANPDAAVVNQGTIRTAKNGSVVLSAPEVQNQGLIAAKLGSVVLGGAKAFTVDMDGDNLIRYQITKPVSQSPHDSDGNKQDALVSNSGRIDDAGGRVLMTARAARNVEDNVINNTGIVEATSVSAHNGEIDLDAGSNGTVDAGGTLDASGRGDGQTGGEIRVTGQTVNVENHARLDASGDQGGGTVLLGGNFHGKGGMRQAENTNIARGATIAANAISSGNGGHVAVWSTGTTLVAGHINARGRNGGNGGYVETSGHNLGMGADARVNLSSGHHGKAGTWLLDPDTIDIAYCSSGCANIGDNSGPNTPSGDITIDPSAIDNALNGGTDVVLQAAQNINVWDQIVYNSANALSLLSEGNVSIYASIQNNGSGNINLVSGWDGASTNIASILSGNHYGASDGDVEIGGENAGGNVYVGSKSGKTTVAAYELDVDAENGEAQLGYHASGGGGIAVDTTQDLVLENNMSSGGYAQIGNGDGLDPGGSATGVTGNINLQIDGSVSSSGSNVWIGNVAAGGPSASGSESGNVNIVAGSGGFGESMIVDDLGDSATNGGNVSIAYTDGDATFGGLGDNYSSPHSFTLADTGNLTVTGNLENDGSGNVNLIAGWDGTTPLGSAFTTAGAYGNNGGSIIIGGPTTGTWTNVGTASGTLNVGGYNVSVLATYGDAQLGYWGDGTGDINVSALNDLLVKAGCSGEGYAMIGNGAAYDSIDPVSGGASGNITVTAGNDISLVSYGEDMSAQIGNGGQLNSGAPASGNITVTAGGALSMTGTEDGSNVQIGNGGLLYGGDTSGKINVSAKSLTMESDGNGNDEDETGSSIQIGNGGGGSYGNSSGAITVNIANSLELNAEGDDAAVQIGNGGPLSNNGDGPGFSDGGNIAVAAKNIYLNGDGNYSVVSIGNGGVLAGSEYCFEECDGNTLSGSVSFGGNISITAKNQIALAGEGEGAADWIGNGGIAALDDTVVNGNVSFAGNINIAAGTASAPGSLTLISGNDEQYFSIGNGGSYLLEGEADVTGTTTTAGNIGITVKGGSSHGGYLTLATEDEDSYASIGNGAPGKVGGDINIYDDGNTQITDEGAWVGGWSDSSDEAGKGDLTIVTYTGNLGGGWFTDDLGVNQNTGGNVTIGFVTTAPIYLGGVSYNSPHNFTFLSGGNMNVWGSATNAGSGNVTLVAGWDGHTLGTAAQIQAAGAFGLHNAVLTIGGASAYGDVTVGSQNGTTTILGHDVSVDAKNYNAQIGYNGNGSGNIVVDATGKVTVDAEGPDLLALIGNGGLNGTGNISGNISITSDGALLVEATGNGDTAQIGNYGNSSTSSESGNIVINTNGAALTILASGGYGTNGPAVAGIGNVNSDDVETSGGATGNITISSGAMTLEASGDTSTTTIGDGGWFTNDGKTGGNINISATKLSLLADNTDSSESEARIANRGNGQVVGNIVVNTTGNVSLLADDANLAAIGNGEGADGTTSGNITVNAGGNLSLTGHDSGQSRISGGAASNTKITVTAAGNIVLTDTNSGASNGGSVLIGNFGTDSVGGSLTLTAGGALTLAATGTNAGVIIGNTDNGPTDATAVGGNINISSASLSETANGKNALAAIGNEGFVASGDTVSGNIKIATGAVTLSATGNAALAQIGGVGNNTATISGAVTIKASGAISLNGGSSAAQTLIGNSGGSESGAVSITGLTLSGDIGPSFFNDIAGGDFALALTGNGTVTLNDGVDYSSSHNATFSNGGNLVFAAGFTNEGSGNISITSGGTVTIGGHSASGNVAVGSKSGSTTISAKNLVLEADNGYAQLGFDGSGSGAISVTTSGDVTLTGRGAGDFAQIGNGGYQTSGNESGNITVSAKGDVTLNGGNGHDSYAQIGNGGSQANKNKNGYSNTGNISVSGHEVVLAAGTGNAAYAQIGNGGYLVGDNLTGGTATNSGNITVSAVELVSLTGGGGEAYAQIGNGGDQINSSPANSASGSNAGNITVTTSDAGGPGVELAAGSGTDAYAQIGNGGFGENESSNTNVNFTDSGDITVSDLTVTGGNGSNGYAQIGNGDNAGSGSANVSGNITISSKGNVTVTNGAGGNAGIGNATGKGTVTGTVTGYNSNPVDDTTSGAVNSLVQTNTNTTTTTTIASTTQPPPSIPQNTNPNPAPESTENPLEKLSDGGDEGTQDSDGVTDSIGNSLKHGGKKTVVTETLIPGVLRQMVVLGANQPHGVPPADQDFSSWGNEALWRW